MYDPDFDWDEAERLLEQAWRVGCQGIIVFVVMVAAPVVPVAFGGGGGGGEALNLKPQTLCFHVEGSAASYQG